MPIIQLPAQPLIKPRHPFKTIEGRQVWGVDLVQLSPKPVAWLAAGHRHGKRAQVKQVQTLQHGVARKDGAGQVPVVGHALFEAAVHKHKLKRVLLNGRIGDVAGVGHDDCPADCFGWFVGVDGGDRATSRTVLTNPMSAPSVLVTGASSGIGAATAADLLQRGWQVFVAARRVEAMAPLAALGAHVLPLDLASEASRQALAADLAQRVGALDALVNNAGFGEVGPMETMPLERARAIFEVNLFGLMGLTQLLLPAMRERGSGRIVNVSSIAGRWVSPGSGWYGASKHALEAISDALRLELHRFGVQVVLIEPGLIATDFAAVADPSIQQAQTCSIYGAMMGKVRAGWDNVYRGASSPEVVARAIATALTVSKPKARYLCGHQSVSVIAHRLLPTRLWDGFVRSQMT